MKYIGGVLRPDDYPSILQRLTQLCASPGWRPYRNNPFIWTSPDGTNYGEELAWHRVKAAESKKHAREI